MKPLVRAAVSADLDGVLALYRELRPHDPALAPAAARAAWNDIDSRDDVALSSAWERGCCKVLLLSGAQRPEAHALYESAGFDGDVERGFVARPRRGD